MKMHIATARPQMKQCNIWMGILFTLLFTQSAVSVDYDTYEEKAINKVKTTLTSKIEAGRPAQPFEVWLQNLAGKDARLKWELNDCGEGTGGPADRERDMPLCIGIRADLPDGRYLDVEVGVASASDMKRSRLPGGVGIRDVYAGYKDVSFTTGSGLDHEGALFRLEEFLKVDVRSIGLYYAAVKGDVQLAQAMLKQGVDIHSGYGKDALPIAAKNEQLAVIPLLLNAGADVNARLRRSDKTALGLVAWLNGNLEIAKLLLASGADADSINDAFMEASRSGRLEMVRLLLQSGADVNRVVGGTQSTPLMSAASENKIAVMRVLIESGADVNAMSGDKTVLGVSALGNSYWTVSPDIENVEGLLLLLEHGAEVRPKNAESPLISAVRIGSLAKTRVLLEHGADINAIARYPYLGKTSLMIAVADGKLKIAKLLVEKGADLNLRGEDGRTALSLAIWRQHPQIAKMLRQAGAK